MTRWLSLFLAVVFGWFSITHAHAYVRPAQAEYDAKPFIGKIVLGDGITMDTGSQTVTTTYLQENQNLTGYSQVIQEHESINGQPKELKVTYIYGPGLVSQKRGNGTYYYGRDGLGSVRYLSDENGTVTDAYAYDAYGIQIAAIGSTSNEHRFAGEYYDWDLGMSYNRARWYKPQIGRFWTMDTYEGAPGDPLSLHKYLYAHNNPVNMTDPSGHFSMGEISLSSFIRTTLFALNVAGAISNAKQTARYSVSAFQAISDDDPWNATLSMAGAVLHGGLTAMNVLGIKSFMSSIGPPPAGGFALAGGGGAGVGRVWQFALSNPGTRKWVFEEFVPVVGGGLGLFVSHMGHEAEWEHRDPQGKIKTRGNSESGSDVPPGRRLNWNEQLQTHTEYKILSEL